MRPATLIHLLATAALLIGASACSDGTDEGGSGPPDPTSTAPQVYEPEPDMAFEGSRWRLERIDEGGAAADVLAGVTSTLAFDVDGTYLVDTGCNRGGGTFVVGEALTFDGPGLTLVSCDGDPGRVERAVVSVLRGGEVAYELGETTLTLTAGQRVLRYVLDQ